MLLAIALCAALGGPALASTEAGSPGESGWLTLRNGARLLLVPDPRATAVDLAVWVEAGVRYERPGIIGISHLLEHLSARGAAPGGEQEVRRLVEAEGGTTASFTTADFTCFTHTVPREALERAFRLEAGRLALRPTQEMLDHDRAFVREETRARAQGNPLEHAVQELYATAFTAHPYRWPVLGRDDDFERISLKDCVDYLRSRYAPDRVWITVVGDFDPDQALALARRHIEPVGRRAGRSRAPAGEPDMSEMRRAARPGVLPVPMLVVGWRAPAAAEADAPALDLLSTLLSRGSAARLQRRLVRGEQSCLFVQTGRDSRRDGTLFWVAAAVRPGRDSSAVEEALVAEIESLAREPVTGEELDRARRQLEISLLYGRQTARDRGQVIGTSQMVVGHWQEADRRLERLRALTPVDLQEAAARTLSGSRRIVVWLAASPAGNAGGRP